VIYLICNELNPNDIEALLIPLGAVDHASLKYEKTAAALARQQSKWQHAILTTFLTPLAGRLIVT
jgi:hypothetical protein